MGLSAILLEGYVTHWFGDEIQNGSICVIIEPTTTRIIDVELSPLCKPRQGFDTCSCDSFYFIYTYVLTPLHGVLCTWLLPPPVTCWHPEHSPIWSHVLIAIAPVQGWFSFFFLIVSSCFHSKWKWKELPYFLCCAEQTGPLPGSGQMASTRLAYWWVKRQDSGPVHGAGAYLPLGSCYGGWVLLGCAPQGLSLFPGVFVSWPFAPTFARGVCPPARGVSALGLLPPCGAGPAPCAFRWLTFLHYQSFFLFSDAAPLTPFVCATGMYPVTLSVPLSFLKPLTLVALRFSLPVLPLVHFWSG